MVSRMVPPPTAVMVPTANVPNKSHPQVAAVNPPLAANTYVPK